MRIEHNEEFVKNKLTPVNDVYDVDYESLQVLLNTKLKHKPVRITDDTKNIDPVLLNKLGFSCVYNFYINEWSNFTPVPVSSEFTFEIEKNPFKYNLKSNNKSLLKKYIDELVADCAKRMPDEFDENGYSDWTPYADEFLILKNENKIVGFIGFDRGEYYNNASTLREIYVLKEYRNQKCMPMMMSLIATELKNDNLQYYLLATDATKENALNNVMLKNGAKLFRQIWKNTDNEKHLQDEVESGKV